MTETNTVFLYVSDAPASEHFYTRLLGIEPVTASPTFVLFVLPSGLALGLWNRDGVEPAAIGTGGGGEIGFKVKRTPQIDAIHADWQAKGATIACPPTDLDFGRSFVALDPDGHRLRVYAVTQDG
ncbi:VOC family protein [Methylobacterium sp. SD274]|uniref:VOC family protein n=1 Tax=Methylobacterium sp. SD274 TaxID=2782009 RepID=UPI001A95664C|nr:VOC family protein [Methylobacterium sp. SD274]MBO1019029.1 VOC family protein [Methylobacterium sp. SD274]